MFDRITKRIAHRDSSSVRRFAALNPKTTAGIASALALGGAALALFGRKRQSHPSPGMLSTDGPDGMTRAELYNEARKRDIPGRSAMSKEELKEALESS